MISDSSDRYQEVKPGDEQWLMRINLGKVDRILLGLLAAFVLLNFVDVLSTLTALSNASAFAELNPIASSLFHLRFPGFLAALFLKYLPLLPLMYGAFITERGHSSRHIRAMKLGTLGALGAADVFYLAVAVNNLTNLALVFH